MIKVIATDLDGTLLVPEKKFSLINKESKKYLQNFYGDIVLVSGRNPKFCAKICNKLKIYHNFIALNGSVIVKNGNVIYRQSMKKTALVSMIDFLDSYYNDFEVLIFDKYDNILSYSPINPKQTKKMHRKNHYKNSKLYEKIIINNKKAKILLNNSIEIYKVIVYSKNCDDMASLLKEKYGDHFAFFTNSHSIEICPIGVSKGAALQYLINTTKVKEDEVFVVGDSINDVPMFDLFPNSFVMSSAPDFIKIHAKNSIDKFTDLEKFTKMNGNFLGE